MKKAGATLAVVVVCVFLLALHFGIPAPNVLNRTYTGVTAGIREPDGSFSITDLQLGQKQAQDVLNAIQSRSYATPVSTGSVVAYAPTREAVLSLAYQVGGRDAITTFAISGAGVITIEDNVYILFPRDERAQIQLFQTIYDNIPK